MILRRVIAHFRKQEWTAIAIDFLIVVFGVFFGIQVANWNAAEADRRAEAGYLLQLQRDIGAIKAELLAQVEFEQYQATLASELFEETREPPSVLRNRRIRIGLSQLSGRRTLRVESPTFVDLQGAGRLDVISDAALRDALIGYFYRTSRIVAGLDKNNAFFIDDSFTGFLRDNNFTYRPWDVDVMGSDEPPRPVLATEFRTKVLSGPLFSAEIGPLDGAPNGPVADEIITRLSWRAFISAQNESLAQQLLTLTSDIEAKLAAEISERRT
ncbi:MAG TPA: hypothetical protein DDZ68_08815 [Parvularcula sp.]|nr:hypothetical protein [Parvularcula sp.]HBS35469.1 hypothetical protein [Parvularcula sp.]